MKPRSIAALFALTSSLILTPAWAEEAADSELDSALDSELELVDEEPDPIDEEAEEVAPTGDAIELSEIESDAPKAPPAKQEAEPKELVEKDAQEEDADLENDVEDISDEKEVLVEEKTLLTPGGKATLKLVPYLKPISDQEWKKLAGPRIDETYIVLKGDTLWDISKRLFDNNHYWPKIWALNNDKITNPHLIYPGNKIRFLPGTGTTLPTVELAKALPPAPTKQEEEKAIVDKLSMKRARSQEWRKLPQQPWEDLSYIIPPEVDPNGFDTRSAITRKPGRGFSLDFVARSQDIEPLGVVAGSTTESVNVTYGDTVFLSALEDLKVGRSYALTREPFALKGDVTGRRGHSYRNVGTVKILGVRDDLFVGTITMAKDPIKRGDLLFSLPPKVKDLKPVPGPSPIEASLILDRRASTRMTSQFRLAFVDRGTNDGVSPGMVFRAYMHQDPSSKEKITKSDFIHLADLMVLQTSEDFSIGMVIRSRVPIHDLKTVVLLTDVSDLLGVKFGSNRDDDELDQLDSGGGLGREEERELRQLENWKGNPDQIDDELDSEASKDDALKSSELAPSEDESKLDEILDEEDGTSVDSIDQELDSSLDSGSDPNAASNATPSDADLDAALDAEPETAPIGESDPGLIETSNPSAPDVTEKELEEFPEGEL